MNKILLNIIFLLPLGFLSYEVLIAQNINDPIKHIYTFTGVSAIIFIFFSVMISLIKKKINLMKYRKIIGLYGFFYAFLHFSNFFILDAQASIEFVVNETLKKPFIYLGMISFLILLFMAITSIKKLYKKYNIYHKFVYLSIILLYIHTLMAQKSIVLIDVIFIVIGLVLGIFKIYQYFIMNKVNKSC